MQTSRLLFLHSSLDLIVAARGILISRRAIKRSIVLGIAALVLFVTSSSINSAAEKKPVGEAALAEAIATQVAGQPLQMAAADCTSSATCNAPSTCKTAITAGCGCPSGLCHEGDQVWLVSSRGVGCSCGLAGENALTICRLDQSGQWQPSDLDSLIASSVPSMPTDVWVHGNWTDVNYARGLALRVYHRSVCCESARPPVRFIAYSWPSDRTSGALESVRMNAQRTFLDAYLLARLLQRFPESTPLSLTGFSYGARIVCGAAHLLAGGSLSGRQLSQPLTGHSQLNIELWAAAMDSCWLAPGQCMGRALAITDCMLAVDDPNDRVLEHYRLLYGRRSGATALGYTGPGGLSAEYAAKVSIMQIYAREHGSEYYYSNDSVMQRTRSYMLMQTAPVNRSVAKPVAKAAAKTPAVASK